jgi:hypothetical protein
MRDLPLSVIQQLLGPRSRQRVRVGDVLIGAAGGASVGCAPLGEVWLQPGGDVGE